MSLIYKSKRVGKDGKIFQMLKFRTLTNGSDNHIFTDSQSYTRFGKFLRKYKLDELPQIINVIKGDMRIFGYRPEEPRTFVILPSEMRNELIKYRPGIIDLSSLYFFNEEKLLQMSGNSQLTYWIKIKPLKFVLQMFYIENRSWALNLAILWIFIKKLLWNFMKK